jgi:hypothetical protein
MRRSGFALLLLGSTISACSGGSGADGGGGGLDASGDAGSAADAIGAADAGGGGRDAAARDGSAADVGELSYGTLIAASGTIVGVTPDEQTLYFVAGSRLMSASTAGGQPVDRGAAPEEWFTRPVGEYLWMTTSSPGDARIGTVSTLQQTATGTPTIVAQGALRSFVFRSDDTRRTVYAANLQSIGSGSTATLTADLLAVRADGTGERTILRGIHVGPFNAASNTFAGTCEPRTAFTSSVAALIALCKDPDVPGPKSLVLVDTERGTARTVAENVRDFLRVGRDGSFAVFRDETLHIRAIDLATFAVTALMEDMPGGGPRVLDGKRFVYFSQNGALKVASYPRLVPSVIETGVRGILDVSPNGAFAMVYQNRSTVGVSDLFAISTATAAPSMPVVLDMLVDGFAGDSPFTDDNRYALWFSDVDAMGIGTIMSRTLDGTGRLITIAPMSYHVLTYAEPLGVLIMTNAHMVGARVIADLAVAKRDGSTPPTTLAAEIDANRYVVFPTTRRRILYRVPAGGHTGLWVRELPAP